MKKILLLVIGLSVISSSVMAATPTPTVEPIVTVTPAPTSANAKQIEDLKDRLATKVAQLRQTQKRAIFGTVKAKTITTATVETTTKDVKIELPDEVKVIQFIKGKRTTLTTENIDVKDVVTVFGDYDSTLDILKASTFFIHNAIPAMLSGTITDIDKKGFVITIKTKEEKTYLIDFETTTKTNAWTKEQGIVKAGFSKLTIGDRIHVTGTPDPKKDNRLSAIRILDIGAANQSSVTVAPTPEETAAVTPSVTPKTTPKITPTSTPKTTLKSPTPTTKP